MSLLRHHSQDVDNTVGYVFAQRLSSLMRLHEKEGLQCTEFYLGHHLHALLISIRLALFHTVLYGIYLWDLCTGNFSLHFHS